MALAGNIIGISAGSGVSQINLDLTQMEQALVALLIEQRIMNKNIVGIGSGAVITDDPNVDRIDALNNGLYANPPVLPTPGQ